jgi:hypothetical protein
VVTLDDVRSLAAGLPRSYEVVVRGRVKFRVGRIVYLDFSRDETIMGFAFPREWRPVLVSSAPHKFLLPIDSELRWNWVRVRLAAIDVAEMRELVLDAWSMVVPRRVAAAYAAREPDQQFGRQAGCWPESQAAELLPAAAARGRGRRLSSAVPVFGRGPRRRW